MAWTCFVVIRIPMNAVVHQVLAAAGVQTSDYPTGRYPTASRAHPNLRMRRARNIKHNSPSRQTYVDISSKENGSGIKGQVAGMSHRSERRC
jgi:hypothetical protein